MYQVKNPWLLFFGVAVGSLMSGIDFLAIAVAIDPMSKALGIDIPTLQWFLSAFAIGNSSFLVTSGRLCDLYGRKTIFIAGSTLFILSSLAIALSSTPLTIIIFRLFQGASSGVTTSAAIAILAHIYSPQERTRWIAGLVGTTGLGMVLGPSLGGILIYYFGWRTIFLINLPLGAIGLLFTLLYMPKLVIQKEKDRLDLLGTLFFTLTFIFFTIGITQGPIWGWSDVKTLFNMIAALVSGAIFILAERLSKYPLIDFSLFKIPNFLSSNAIASCMYFALTGWTFVFGLYLQRVVKMSPQLSGISFLPFGLMVLFLSTQIDRISARIGMKNTILLGAFLGILSFLGLALTPIEPSYWTLAPFFLLFGGCFVIINACTMQAGLEHVPLNRAGIASGKSMMVRWLWGAIGAAVTSTLFVIQSSKKMQLFLQENLVDFENFQLLNGVILGELPADAVEKTFQGSQLIQMEEFIRQAYHHGLVISMWTLFGFMLIAFFIGKRYLGMSKLS